MTKRKTQHAGRSDALHLAAGCALWSVAAARQSRIRPTRHDRGAVYGPAVSNDITLFSPRHQGQKLTEGKRSHFWSRNAGGASAATIRCRDRWGASCGSAMGITRCCRTAAASAHQQNRVIQKF